MLEEKLVVESALEKGTSLIDIADSTGIPMIKLKRYNKEWLDHKQEKIIVEVIKEDEKGLEKAIGDFKGELGKQADFVDFSELDKALEGKEGLVALNKEMQETCSLALKRADMFLDPDNLKLTPSQWKTIVDGIAGMYSQIFVPQGTNINIMNNNGGGDTELNGWKGSLR